MQLVKETLGSDVKFTNKFSASLSDLANVFVHKVAEEANKKTIAKGKMKIMPEDILATVSELGFTEQEIENLRKKTKEFEESETVSLLEEERAKSQAH